MTTRRFLLGIVLCSSVLLGSDAFAAQHNASSSGTAASLTGTPVRTIITVRQRHGHGDETPDITQRDVQVRQGRDLRPVTEWVPAQGQQAGLELLLLLDDSSRFVLRRATGRVAQVHQRSAADNTGRRRLYAQRHGGDEPILYFGS